MLLWCTKYLLKLNRVAIFVNIEDIFRTYTSQCLPIYSEGIVPFIITYR